MSDALRELLVVFGMQVDSGPLEKADAEVERFGGRLGELAVTIAEVFAFEKLAEFVKGTAEMGEHLEAMSNRLNIATDDIQRFQYGLVLTGGSIEGADQALTLFSKNLGEAAQGGASAQVFQKLGVQIRGAGGEIRPTTEIIGDLADGFTKLKSGGEKTATAMQLFGRSGATMIPFLNEGKDGVKGLFDEFDKSGGLIDEKTVGELAKVAENVNGLSFAMNGLKAQIVAALGPAVIWLINKLESGASVLSEMAQKTTLVRGVMEGLIAIAVLAAVVWGALNIEFLLIVAAVALMVLVLDDLQNWWEGNDSLFGRIIDKLFGVGSSHKLLDTLRKTIHDLGDSTTFLGGTIDVLGSAFYAFYDILKLVFDIMVGLVKYILAIPDGIDAMSKATTDLFDDINKDNDEFIKDISGQGGQERAAKRAAAAAKAAKDAANADYDKNVANYEAHPDEASAAEKAFNARMAARRLAAAAAPPTATGGASGTSAALVHQQNHTTITVNGVKGAAEATDAIGDSVSGAQKDYLDDFSAAPGGG